jgi:hypothetical protein
MVLILVVLLAGLLSITAFFYGGQMVLQWLEMPDSPQALGSFVGQFVPVDNIRVIGIRPLLKRSEIPKLLDRLKLPTRSAENYKQRTSDNLKTARLRVRI